MKQLNNNKKYLDLRAKFDFFEFQSYNYYLSDNKLMIEYKFNLSDKYFFNPKLEIPLSKSIYTIKDRLPDLKNIVFHLGMIELISYWKTACPKKLIIKPHSLNSEQITWWKKLYFNGLGEFFYLNTIKVNENDFIEIRSEGGSLKPHKNILDHKKVIVPIGGGKDSVVTLEVLKNSDLKIYPMMLNPGEAGKRTVENAGYSSNNTMTVKRTLDTKLLELNKDGFLNGHTPFSALLAFTNVLLGIISDCGNIALSNENSANESTVPGTNINHQYSKSYEFEQDFDYYLSKYIHPGLNYFSFLRLFNELQIAILFSSYSWHYESFRSCNVGSKKDEWCGKCSKCLFTYIILSPFIDRETLISIFGKNMFADSSLSDILLELTGNSAVKPFECVGTIREVNTALAAYMANNSEFADEDTLLSKNKPKLNKESGDFDSILAEFNEENNLPGKFMSIVKSVLYD